MLYASWIVLEASQTKKESEPRHGRRLAAWLLLASIACGCSSERLVRPLRAQESPETLPAQGVDPDAGYKADFRAKQGVLAQVRHYRSRLSGDFDGDTTLTGPDTIFIPEADDGSGYSIALGGMEEGNAFLLSYRRIEYDGEIGNLDADVEYRAFALEVLHFFRANEPVQPYLQLEMLLPFADLVDASTDGVAVGNAKLREGFGLGVGGGVAWWLSRRLARDVRAEAADQWFSSAEGVRNNEEDIDDDLDASNYGISIGLSWALGGPS